MAEEKDTSTATGGLDARLIALCVLLWVVAAGILWQNWPDTKKDYYWGNIMQGLDSTPRRIDSESIEALAAMGDAVVPSCSYELSHHFNPLFRCAVLTVLQRTEGKGARDLMEWAVRNDLDARVRANGLIELRERTKRHPDEMAPLKRLCDEVALGKAGDPNIEVRTMAALLLGQEGDSRPEVKAYLVHGLRSLVNPLIRSPVMMRECATVLAKINAGAPAFNLEAKGKDILDEIVKYETWCTTHDIALVESALTIAPVASGAGVGPVSSKTGDGK